MSHQNQDKIFKKLASSGSQFDKISLQNWKKEPNFEG